MKGRWAVLALVALGTFMTTLDASIVNISLPSIARTFHTPIGSAVERVIIGVSGSTDDFGRYRRHRRLRRARSRRRTSAAGPPP